jgi:hypothetical protein
MEECNAWKYSHQWLDKYNTLKKKAQKWDIKHSAIKKGLDIKPSGFVYVF